METLLDLLTSPISSAPIDAVYLRSLLTLYVMDLIDAASMKTYYGLTEPQQGDFDTILATCPDTALTEKLEWVARTCSICHAATNDYAGFTNDGVVGGLLGL